MPQLTHTTPDEDQMHLKQAMHHTVNPSTTPCLK